MDRAPGATNPGSRSPGTSTLSSARRWCSAQTVAPGACYTNGTTGGAAYALAIGSKLRRDAQVTLITYRDGRPVGIQPVTVRTVGDFRVGEYTELDLEQQLVEPEVETENSPLPEESP